MHDELLVLLPDIPEENGITIFFSLEHAFRGLQGTAYQIKKQFLFRKDICIP